MPSRSPDLPSPGYGHLWPILFGLASIGFFISCLPLLDRNSGCRPMDPAVHGQVLDYIEDDSRAEGQVLRVRLVSRDTPFAVVTTRDDRPWRTFTPGESVRVLCQSGRDSRGHPTLEYIIDDFAAKWGGLLARGGAAVASDLAAVFALLLARRQPSAARHFPPPVPRSR